METGKRSSGLCNDNNNQTGSDVTNDLKMENGEELVKTFEKFNVLLIQGFSLLNLLVLAYP
jgi:hypothetical protein